MQLTYSWILFAEHLANILGHTKQLIQKAPLVDVLKLVEGGIYLVKFDDEWFRGQILRVTSQQFYVEYFDFGNRKYLTSKEAEFSFRVLGPALSPKAIFPAAIRVQLRNVPNLQQYNFLKRIVGENIDEYKTMNLYVMGHLAESDSYHIQLDEPQ